MNSILSFIIELLFIHIDNLFILQAFNTLNANNIQYACTGVKSDYLCKKRERAVQF
ncbi:hypothetical protein XIS1_850005 [Xenorhabdus innexi]|uniref:Uncharacterized protein n=1 Tax=Xenorhabdus innexi TaxID=290109 RepID=A0A1N6N175_9GAMM|nr:hypothetical protein Xinn_02993 [Xenorhabdus innexi]SIP74799.1 hypothetical protein XIS1_850005 [Xenorhabdus innexi]